MRVLPYRWFIVCCLCLMSLATQALQADNQHARTWNKFANDVLALHKQRIAKIPHRVTTQTGGYAAHPDFYTQQTFIDMQGKVVSRVQWEAKAPQQLHAIEVFVRDQHGRVLRDYVAAYLPDYRNAPTQTLLSLHQYNDQLHAFRSFDASGARVVERCTGQYKGNAVDFILDEDEIDAGLSGDSDRMQQADYQACFNGLDDQPGAYLVPH